MFKPLAGAIAVAFSFASIAQGAPPPAEAFGGLPAVSMPSLSPDGKHLATIQPIEGRPGVLIWTLGAPKGTAPKLVRDNYSYIVSIHWANNDRLLITVNRNANARVRSGEKMVAWYRTVSVDTNGENNALMFSDALWRSMNFSASTIQDIDLDDPRHVYMSMYAPGLANARLQLYRVDVTDGSAQLVQEGSLFTHDFIMDGKGRVVGRVALTARPLTDHVEVPDGNGWREIAQYDASGGEQASMQGVSQDGTHFVRWTDDAGHGFAGLRLVDPSTGKESDLYASEKFDVDDVLRDPWTGRVIGAMFRDELPRYHYFDPKMEGLQQGLEAAFPGLSVHAVSWNIAIDKLVVETQGPRQPIAYYLLDRNTHEASKLASTYPDVHDGDLGERKVYSYSAQDGLTIPAYLTLPPGKAPTNLPAIVFPHGGPFARDTLVFDWEAAYFASRGYAVLQPNFRGSDGYGRSFEAAGYGQYGIKMLDDMADGAKKLAQDGIADPKRICVVGMSYGGYAALASAAFRPGIYACAVSLAGVSDLHWLGYSRFESDTWSNSWWAKVLAKASPDELDAVSPVRHAERIDCPVLLMHGDRDATVPLHESEAMRDALQSAGKSVEYVVLDSDSHYLQLADSRVRFLKETDAFLAKHIGN